MIPLENEHYGIQIRIPYILAYKSYFLYSEIDTKIVCDFYVGQTKRKGMFGII